MAPAAAGEGEAAGQKRKKKPKQKHVAPSQSLHASKPPPSAPFLQTPTQSPAPGTPILEEAAMMRRKIRKGKKVAALPLPQNPTVEEEAEAGTATNKSCPDASKSLHAAPFLEAPAQSPTPGTPMLEDIAVEAATRKIHKENNGKRPRVRVLSKRELIKEASKKKPALPQGFAAFTDFVTSSTEHNPEHSSRPCAAFFDQFRYNPVCGDHKPTLPRTPDRIARLPLRRRLHAKEKKSPEKETKTKKQREPPPLLTRAEKCSDIYRRVPLDQLVPPPRSPHNLLQEEYASDPWKVIVICMLLNLTHGKQVKNIIEGFFEIYPDAQSAYNADPDKMAGHLAYLGLQRVKTTRIQRFSKEYVETEWTYITELCGVGKYAADAYAIFCAGRATEVVPKDHKLVDYWKYVCFEAAADAAMRKRKMRKEKKVAALPLPQNPTLEEQEGKGEEAVLATTTTKKKHRECKSCPSLSAAETPILDPGQTQSQGTKVADASKSLPAAPFLEAPAQSLPPGTLMLEDIAAEAAMRKRKVRKEHKVAVLPLAQNPTLEEQAEECGLVMTKKKQRERKPSPSPSTDATAETPILEKAANMTKKRKICKEQGPSCLPLDPGQTQPQGTKDPHASMPQSAAQFIEAPAQSPTPGTSMLEEAAVAVTRKIHKENNGKRPCVRVLSKRELIKEASKKKPALPQGFAAFTDFVSSSTGQNAYHSSPCTAFFDQFRYNPVRGDHKPTLPRTPDRIARLPPRGHSSFGSSQLTADETTMASKSNTFVASKTKQLDSGSPSGASFYQFSYRPTDLSMLPPWGYPSFELPELSVNGSSKANNSVARKSKKKDSGLGSASGSLEKLHAKEKKSPEKETKTKKQREPPPLLTRAEKCSDKYRRVPLDRLVPPPRSPHNLLQEKYASDPWKVIVICMLVNLGQGKQAKNIIEGFFEIYPDAQSAYNADPDKMARHLAYLGLQRVKTTRIQRFSKEYVETEWTYITELCGVDKYAADAYAIFCAGRATEVVPKDHKLVDYWKYVCFELPMMQKSQNVQEAGILEQEFGVMC